jgi:hypothetical protein
MTQLEAYCAPRAVIGSRFTRLPMVFLLTVGLLLSLVHCAGCEFNFASSGGLAVAVSQDQGSPPDTPEQQLPCHSGHCLSHVAAQSVAGIVLPVDPHPPTHVMRQEQFTVVLAGLALFKPPRA